MPASFRFTLGQLMGLVAIVALLMANASFITHGNYRFTSLISTAIECAVLGVLIYHRRLSAWIWVSIIGQGGQLLWLLMATLQGVLLSSPLYSDNIFLAIQLTVSLLASLLFVLGFAMTLQDLGRRLAIYENAE